MISNYCLESAKHKIMESLRVLAIMALIVSMLAYAFTSVVFVIYCVAEGMYWQPLIHIPLSFILIGVLIETDWTYFDKCEE